jgi:DNA topoisomerase-1
VLDSKSESLSCEQSDFTAPLAAPLFYVDDTQPGIRRRLLRGHFAYYDAQGTRITDAEQIARINRLAIPPAYQDVWICADPNGHLQATGRDARGRKQYRYHEVWRTTRDSNKYQRMLDFGAALPRLRKQLEQHLALRDLSRERVLATVVTLLESTLIRVGNRRYARENRSYGLTTLRTRHVEVKGAAIRFQFRGKSGIEHRVTLKNPRLARIMRRCMELPGQQLFQYLDAEGQRHEVTSSDINSYLRQISQAEFTAKDYRTWAGSTLALAQLRNCEWQPEAHAKQHLVQTIKQVASQLGNTPAVCRNCYIHPQVMEGYLSGQLMGLPRARKRKWLSAEEVGLMVFLQQIQAQNSTQASEHLRQ